MDQSMATDPGRVFVYCSGATEMLVEILKKATGKQADDYAAEHLFKPLGITKFYWKRTPTGLPDAEGGLYLTKRDLAKFGYLYLKNGMWENGRIIPHEWIKVSTAPAVDASGGMKYGYQWWVLPYQGGAQNYAYAARGYGGQALIVVPEYNLIAVFTGWNIYETPALSSTSALGRVLQAVKR
jgi:CubicO group peptidase (beta-lactamase class C family)